MLCRYHLYSIVWMAWKRFTRVCILKKARISYASNHFNVVLYKKHINLWKVKKIAIILCVFRDFCPSRELALLYLPSLNAI